MKSLRTYISDALDEQLAWLQKSLQQTEDAIQITKTLNVRKGHYQVNLNSLWADEGEKSTKTKYTGSLENAIKAAEKKFLKINSRSDIQATYHVQIRVGKIFMSVPKKYWEEYMKKH